MKTTLTELSPLALTAGFRWRIDVAMKNPPGGFLASRAGQSMTAHIPNQQTFYGAL